MVPCVTVRYSSRLQISLVWIELSSGRIDWIIMQLSIFPIMVQFWDRPNGNKLAGFLVHVLSRDFDVLYRTSLEILPCGMDSIEGKKEELVE